MRTAITRRVSPRIAECELTHLDRVSIDPVLAQTQHGHYVRALADLGCKIVELPAEDSLPDSVFVEDTAVILPEVALVTRPGAVSRRPETESIVPVLRAYRELVPLKEPASLDGGDVLVVGKRIFVGLSSRSNRSAIEQMQSALGRFGYQVQGVELRGCLHLKSAVTRLDDSSLLIHRPWVDAAPFAGYALVDVDPAEPFAANILMVGEIGIYPQAFPRSADLLTRRGMRLRLLDVSEIAKAEGALTCCSLIVENSGEIV